MLRHVTRRTFLRTTTASIAALPLATVSRTVLGSNERLAVACIGVGGRGRADVNGVAAHDLTSIIALGDVDDGNLAATRKDFAAARTFNDYRVMFDTMEKQIDAVVIGTPDHTHAPAMLRALRMKKHVYCEKPLTRTVAEARVIATETARAGVVTQMGTQIHARTNYRRVVELVQSGAIGAVRRVHTWVDGGWHGGDRFGEKKPVPAGLHWDLWLGPAPSREYRTELHPFYWRGWWNFGGGTLADMACHHMDLPFWALGLRRPTSVEARGPEVHGEYSPRWLIVDYHFAARSRETAGHGGFLGKTSKNPGGPPVHLTWYHGGKRPPEVLEGKAPNWGAGSLLVGEKGMLMTDYNRHRLLPEKDFTDFEPPAAFIPDSVGHHAEWVDACRSGGPTTCNFSYAGALTEAVLLGNVSHRCGSKLEWEAEKLEATNTDAAAEYVRQYHRRGWEV